MRLLLISNNINQSLEGIYKYLYNKYNIMVINYDFENVNEYTDLLKLIQSSTTKYKNQFSSIGIMFHNNNGRNRLQCFANDNIMNTKTGYIKDFTNFQTFVRTLKIFYNIIWNLKEK